MTDPALIEPATPRLRLRQWRDADREPFAALNGDPQVMAHFPATLDRAASDALLDRCRAGIAGRGWGLWAVERREDGVFLGFVGLNVPAVELPFGPCVEVGWRLAAHAWGQGYATEGARAALQAGFGQLGLAEIVAFTTPGNLRSLAVMQRLGMRHAGRFDHPALPAGHHLREHVLMRLARAQWRP